MTPGHQGWNDLHSLCRIGMEYYLLNNDDNNIIYWIMMIIIIPAHSSGTGQMFLEDKIHGFKYTYISDENVQQTKWYHSSIVLRKVHQFIIKKPMCYVGKAIYKTHGLHRRSTRDTINPGIRFTNTGPQSTRITTSMAYDLQFELKSKQAGLTKSKPSIALSKAASYHKANHWS